uniref:Putative product n=1 Tax=Xenopsylla cheopis TaxID=163159 RepID=A0A6M2E0I2_XENCH
MIIFHNIFFYLAILLYVVLSNSLPRIGMYEFVYIFMYICYETIVSALSFWFQALKKRERRLWQDTIFLHFIQNSFKIQIFNIN